MPSTAKPLCRGLPASVRVRHRGERIVRRRGRHSLGVSPVFGVPRRAKVLVRRFLAEENVEAVELMPHGCNRACGWVQSVSTIFPWVQHGFVQPSPDARSRPDQEPAVRGRLRYPEARRQLAPGTTADQHVDDRREQRLIRRVLRSAALRTHPRRRDQRLRDLPQPVRNNPTPRTPPHERTNDRLTT